MKTNRFGLKLAALVCGVILFSLSVATVVHAKGSKEKAAVTDTSASGVPAVAAASEVGESDSTANPSEDLTLKSEAETPLTLHVQDAKRTSTADSGRLFATLAVVCGFAIAGALALQRWAKLNKKQSPSTKIQILTQHHLGPKKSLAIIQVAGEALLIGITDQNISMLKTLALIDDEVPGLVPKNFADELEHTDRITLTGGQTVQKTTSRFGLESLDRVRAAVANFGQNDTRGLM